MWAASESKANRLVSSPPTTSGTIIGWTLVMSVTSPRCCGPSGATGGSVFFGLASVVVVAFFFFVAVSDTLLIGHI